MLNVLRKKGIAKKVLWIVAGLIILSFGFMGQAYLLDGSNGNYAGKVFGRKVSREEFAKNYRHTSIQALMQYGESFYRIREFLNLESQTWDRIILLQEAQKRNIKVPDQLVVDTIQNYKIFQRDGQFDRLLYNDALKYVLKMGPRDFEEGVRDTLKFSKLYELETADVAVPEADVLEAYKRKNEKAQVSYILFPTDNFVSQVNFDENQSREYYTSHQADFVAPEMVNVEYLRLDLPADATPEIQQQVKDKAAEIAAKLTPQAEFSAVAQEFGLKSEESGFFSMEQPNLQIGWSYDLLQKIFDFQVGQISEPIATANGYQVLRLKEKQPSHTPDYETAKDKVKEAWVRDEAKKLAEQKAITSLQAIRVSYDSVRRPDFIGIAKEQGFNIEQTPVFSRGEYLPKVGLSKDFQDTTFALNENNKLSGVVEAEKGYCILHLDSVLPIDMDDFAKHQEEFRQELLQEKRAARFMDILTHLRLKANVVDNISNRSKIAGEPKT